MPLAAASVETGIAGNRAFTRSGDHARLPLTHGEGSATAPAPVASDDASVSLGLPHVDARAMARRAVLPGSLVVAVAAAVVVAGAPLETFADAVARALAADARWVAAAALFELLSFAGYIALLWLVVGRATPRMGLRASAQVTLGGTAASRLLPAAGLGGVAMTIWILRRAGLGAREAARSLVSFLVVLYSVFLAAIAVSGVTVATGLSAGDGPLVLSAVPALAAAGVIFAALSFALFVAPSTLDARPHDGSPGSRSQRLLAGARHLPTSLSAAVHDAFEVIRRGDPRLLGAPAWWAFDAAVLWAMLEAFGAPPALAVVVLSYFVGQVANTLPLPAAVSGGMVGVLLAFGVGADLALASVLAYRAVAIWVPSPIGLLALRGLRRTVAEWADEDIARLTVLT